MANTEKKSVKTQILEHLQSGGEITPLIALNRFNCLSLPARIFELRREGYAIQSELIETKSGKHVARYWINK
ncbi:MAG: hypothetical protein J6Y25_04425 [Elusimicrobiaceae bacterium]|nr:hypothetical protein [Elusimicrobiaceae bacterium]